MIKLKKKLIKNLKSAILTSQTYDMNYKTQ
jgi:hypothetical protein